MKLLAGQSSLLLAFALLAHHTITAQPVSGLLKLEEFASAELAGNSNYSLVRYYKAPVISCSEGDFADVSPACFGPCSAGGYNLLQSRDSGLDSARLSPEVFPGNNCKCIVFTWTPRNATFANSTGLVVDMFLSYDASQFVIQADSTSAQAKQQGVPSIRCSIIGQKSASFLAMNWAAWVIGILLILAGTF